MFEFTKMPDDDYLPNDRKANLFIPIMNILASTGRVSSKDPWRFLFGIEGETLEPEEYVVSYCIWEDGSETEEQIDLTFDDDEVEVVYWKGPFIRDIFYVDYDGNLLRRG